ncbi:hypothetical protein NHQ30_004037 [Ciborinia camelliae]|nr:hypothetical protein NHQ30_004037 [Ciborinia camelliae]
MWEVKFMVSPDLDDTGNFTIVWKNYLMDNKRNHLVHRKDTSPTSHSWELEQNLAHWDASRDFLESRPNVQNRLEDPFKSKQQPVEQPGLKDAVHGKDEADTDYEMDEGYLGGVQVSGMELLMGAEGEECSEDSIVGLSGVGATALGKAR